MILSTTRRSSGSSSTSVQLILLLGSCYLLQLVECAQGSNSLEKDLTLTLLQKQTLDKFKQRVANRLPRDYMKQDIYLIRWLRARNFNVDQAEQMLNENLKWRKNSKIDTILKEDWSEFHEKYPYNLDTISKDGKPILTGNFGDWDIRAIALAGRMPQLIRYLDSGMEDATTMVRKFQSQGKNVTQFDFLVNMDNYNIVQHGCLQCITFYLALVSSYENHFPGDANKIVLFNTPPVFEIVLRVIRPIMSPITRNALQVYGQDKGVWSKVLLNIADKSQLTPEYGGTYKRQEQ
ncbi:SEC14-like protein 2 [Orchesella cincta]|uniref:SEC14-like protein 2 n=1 Tax=Orchesella cincta TaxID=48709 RepID=A0A1D2NFV5_ORCCI|nr:SEC14-like protein 2 [Orchesella cincta]